MKNSFWKTTLAVIVGLFIYSIISSVLWILFFVNLVLFTGKQSPQIPKKAYLNIDLSQGIKDKVLEQDFSSLMGKGPLSMVDIKNAIAYAMHDPHIVGILINSRVVGGDLAQIEEIRDAIKDFKTSGKPVIAFSDIYDTKAYYLASVADKVYIVPTGTILWKGLSAHIFYYKNLLEKLKIEPILIRHGEYKSAGEPFVRDKMSKENREQYKLLLSRMWYNIIKDISKTRNIDTADLNNMADNLAIRGSDYALKFGLVDGQIYYEQLEDSLISYSNGKLNKLKTIGIRQYYKAVKEKISRYNKNKIAVIYAQGPIVDVKSNMKIDEYVIVGKKYAKLIKKLREDSNIKAIVLRVNSPGGSALASERILHQIKLTVKEKPVIVSMGGVAASGGYYISCQANKIVADKNTLTGSIGVFGLLFDLEKFMTDKLNINVEVVKTHSNADMGNIFKPMSKTEKDYFYTMIEDIYDTFISHVAEGRNLDKDYVDKIARGRVWAAEDAYRLGLVDTLGGLDLAVDLAVQAAGLREFSIVEYPKPKSYFELMFDLPNSTKIDILNNVIPGFYDVNEIKDLLTNGTKIWAMMPEKIIIR